MKYYTNDGWTEKLPDWARTGCIYSSGYNFPQNYPITPIPMCLTVRDDNWNKVRVWLSYHQCCGLREFGDIVYVDPHKFKEFFYKVANKLESFGCAGAFTYTQVSYDKKQSWEYQEFFNLLDNVSYSEPWYNPNSGNWVRVLTIPHNQEKAFNADTSDNEDEDDEY